MHYSVIVKKNVKYIWKFYNRSPLKNISFELWSQKEKKTIEKVIKNIFNNIRENCPTQRKRCPYKRPIQDQINKTKEQSPLYILQFKIKNKGKLLKTSREKGQVTCQASLSRVKIDFSTKPFKDRRVGKDVFQFLKDHTVNLNYYMQQNYPLE